ncbi:hypothetical protein PCCS19_44130 [Paenibacillus sp. CCS19]|uniref:DUF58 domain-containing protein n=1 Tax=Paenibacillus sp. CCS19 TaxID=3158387 RepID=UPI00255F6B39|nr:DUF58 domain-containing protein [Paenibacillus cellulosilyticus]GMK41357.1 hypothetical protein PCCS19_44130 [Paenibacillus cellulosilyticus]
MRGSNRSSNRWRWAFVAVIYVFNIMYFMFQGGKTPMMLFVILNVLIIYLFLGQWSGIRLVQGSRVVANNSSGDGTMHSGMSVEVSLGIRVPGFYPLPYVLVRDRLLRHDGQSIPFETSFVPNWKRTGEVSYTTPPLKRGVYQFAPTQCTTRDVFGLFEHSGSFEANGTFSVVPQAVPLRNWYRIRRGMRGPHSHASAPRAAKETTQINGVREYLYGDKLSRVHWNATAKTGEWKSKAFERESLPRTIVILDRHSEAYGVKQERFELAVSVTASIIELGTRHETAMGLVSPGERSTVLPPRTGIEQREQMIRHLTVVEPDAAQPLFVSIQKLEPVWEPGTLVVIISGAANEDMYRTMSWLSRKGVSLTYIGVDESDARFGRLIKTAWLQSLRAKGWTALSVRQLQELPSVLEGGGAS